MPLQKLFNKYILVPLTNSLLAPGKIRKTQAKLPLKNLQFFSMEILKKIQALPLSKNTFLKWILKKSRLVMLQIRSSPLWKSFKTSTSSSLQKSRVLLLENPRTKKNKVLFLKNSRLSSLEKPRFSTLKTFKTSTPSL